MQVLDFSRFWLGSIVSLFLFRRRFLAILDYIYRACRGRNDRDIVKLSGRALSELLVAATLIPIAVSNLATDASSWGIGAVMADAPLAFVEELHRFALRNPSSCARCLSMRVGEASNPGPERLGVLLEDTPLVEAKTASLQAKVWKRFVFWIRSSWVEELQNLCFQIPSFFAFSSRSLGMSCMEKAQLSTSTDTSLSTCRSRFLERDLLWT